MFLTLKDNSAFYVACNHIGKGLLASLAFDIFACLFYQPLISKTCPKRNGSLKQRDKITTLEDITWDLNTHTQLK